MNYYEPISKFKHWTRFWSKVDRTQSCWNWTAAKNQSGYGRFNLAIKTKYTAHIISYCLFNKDYDDKFDVCHKCDNPSCVNPKHLFLATRSENMRDCVTKGRKNAIKPYTKLSDLQVAEIRNKYSIGYLPTDLAVLYDISESYLYEILCGKKRK